MHNKFITFVRELYQSNEFIPLHEPTFQGNEKKYVLDTLETGFVSSVGTYVDKFEREIENYTKSTKAIATVNGTAALHSALHLAGVTNNNLVITQPLTFVATCNAISQLGAQPLFIDISKVSLGLCPVALAKYLDENAYLNNDGVCLHKKTQQVIRATVPMHTFGHPVQLDELLIICNKWNIVLIEDAAESLGSLYKGKHTGTIGRFGAISFNGNKIITTGGGGMVLCKNECDGKLAKHITTTAKVPHQYEYDHDQIAYNYRMPNLNSALGCAQIEKLPEFIIKKRALAKTYQEFFSNSDYQFIQEPDYAQSNYWLNAIICPTIKAKEELLKETNVNKVMTRPAWKLMHELSMYSHSLKGDLSVAEKLTPLILNIPSSPIFSN